MPPSAPMALKIRKLGVLAVLGDVGMVSLLNGLYFDGRKDKTLVIKAEAEAFASQNRHRRTLCSNSGSSVQIYGTRSAIIRMSCEYCTEYCHSRWTNTGQKGGVLRLLEKYCDKPMQRFICQLQENERPLRHLFQHFYRQINGPRTYPGPIV
nr:unnamed protein product [Callosobruchus analis]